MPPWCNWLSTPQNSRRDTGSTPVVGSSSSSSSGSVMSAATRASFCFMPPDSAPASRAPKRSSPTRRSRPSALDRVTSREKP